MKAVCLIVAVLAVGASAATSVAPAQPAHQNWGGGGRRGPVVCAAQQCTVAPGGTCGTSNCVMCFPTFTTNGDLTTCDASCTDSNCLRCNITNANQCLECANDGTSPFYVDASGACAECTATNCAARGWGSTGSCRTDGFCKKCAKGFGRAADNTCVACDGTDGIENCAVCSQDNAKLCYRCKPGYFWDGAACTECNVRVPANPGCANCPAAGVCKECLIGYASVWSRITRTVTCTACPEGCARCDTAGKCSACVPRVTEGGKTTFWVFDALSKACYGPFVDNA